MISESKVREALKDDMMREILKVTNDELEEMKDAFENEDWENQLL